MNNKEIAAVLDEIAVLLELAGENPFKARSYSNVARQIEQLEEPIEVLVAEKRLRTIKGVGEALEEKITELVNTGRLSYLEALRSKFPETLLELFAIPGLGAKRIKTLYEELGISSLGELEYACNENRLLTLNRFGPKIQKNVLEGIAFLKRGRGLHLFSTAYEAASCLLEHLKKEKGLIRIEIAGSLRRRKEVVKDIDIVASARDSTSLMERFVSFEAVEKVVARGDTKSSIMLKSGINADLRVVSDLEFPYALHHFTGSKEHNIAMRQRAKDRGLKMNEYGLFRGDENILCKDEAEIFAQLDLPFIPPELREDMGELEVSELPRLVERSDLLGVFHCHTSYSDGIASVEEMAQAAVKRGFRYIVIADHSKSAGYAGGLSESAVAEQAREIAAVNKRLKSFRVFHGIESDIRADGSLDYSEDVLSVFEIVIASIHTKLNMTMEEATSRVIKAIENPYTAVLGHPTGRLLLSREGYPLDMEKVFDACVEHDVAVEINANPHRLDIDWRHIRRGKEKGVRFCISPDAHSAEALNDIDYGVGIARKGWLEARDILNCWTVEELERWLCAKRARR